MIDNPVIYLLIQINIDITKNPKRYARIIWYRYVPFQQPYIIRYQTDNFALNTEDNNYLCNYSTLNTQENNFLCNYSPLNTVTKQNSASIYDCNFHPNVCQ